MSRIRFFLLALLVLISGTALAQVSVDRAEPAIQHHTFDPKKPPRDMPKLAANESAITRTYFRADARIRGSAVEKKQTSPGEFQVVMKIDRIDMSLKLEVETWVPREAVPKVINHEDGHRELAERYYRGGDEIARSIAQGFIGQTVTGTGRDAESAGKIALKSATDAICRLYLDQTDVPCGKAQDIYDQITAHGTNAVKEQRALEEAIRRVAEQKPTSTTLP